MCVRGHQRAAAALGLIGERRDQRGDRLLGNRDATLEVETKVERDLLVSGTSGVKAAARLADALHELALDERMHVLVRRCFLRVEECGIGATALEYFFEASTDRAGIGSIQDPGCRQRLCPRQATAHVVFEQPPVELERRPELQQELIGRFVEAPGPEMRHEVKPSAAGSN